MPQIDTPLLLDVLLGLVIVLFVPFGIRRGVAKEAMVSAGIFLGATLATRYGERWGDELTTRFAIQSGAATFAVSALLLFGGAFVLGYGGGAALGSTRPGTLSRLVGGLLAAFNAALLLSYLMNWIVIYLQQGATFDEGIVSEALLLRTDQLLLAGAGVLLVLTVLSWLVGAFRARREPREFDAGQGNAAARQRPPRVASVSDSGKYEPGPEEIARSGRFSPSLDATSPLTGSASYAARPVWSEGDRPQPTNGHSREQYPNGASHYGGPAQAAGDDTVWAWGTQAGDEARQRGEAATSWPVAPAVGVTADDRCAVCHARVGPRDVFCPECGATL